MIMLSTNNTKNMKFKENLFDLTAEQIETSKIIFCSLSSVILGRLIMNKL
jgi:hypothetical protein